MLKGYVLIGAAVVALCHATVSGAAELAAAKAPVAAPAATAILFGGTCANFPLIISNPGSYVLAGNVTVPCAVDAMDVKADNVVIDLGGYTISGTGSGSGIGINGSTHSNITVRNGSVVKMGGGGISLGSNATIEDVTASTNGTAAGTGFGVQIVGGIVHRVHAIGNLGKANLASGNGIASGRDSADVSDCEASGNSVNGIQASGSISHNTVRNNLGTGIDGSGTISGNFVMGNGASGIAAQGVITNNDINSNGGNGIFGGGQISNNRVELNGQLGEVSIGSGIFVAVADTSIFANTITQNFSYGIESSSDNPQAGFFSYGNNHLFANNSIVSGFQVLGGVQMGPNVCGGALCP